MLERKLDNSQEWVRKNENMQCNAWLSFILFLSRFGKVWHTTSFSLASKQAGTGCRCCCQHPCFHLLFDSIVIFQFERETQFEWMNARVYLYCMHGEDVFYLVFWSLYHMVMAIVPDYNDRLRSSFWLYWNGILFKHGQKYMECL